MRDSYFHQIPSLKFFTKVKTIYTFYCILLRTSPVYDKNII